MRALITGINGQDGSYLAELLLEKGYEVYGMIRRTSEPLTTKIDHLKNDIKLLPGDMTDSGSIHNVITISKPEEIYNLAAMSQVRWSYDVPSMAFDVNTVGFLRIIEAVRDKKLNPKIYQACSSEMFGKVLETPQKETTPFNPQSPYGASKAAAYHMAQVYKRSYGMRIYCGILFNHESPRRGQEFLSRKVCKAVADIKKGKQELLIIGNLEGKRDFGYAKEYVEWIWNIMQHPEPDDFVIATGETHSVREWIELSFAYAGMPIEWKGNGVDEVGIDEQGNVRVAIDPKFFRPAEVDLLLGDASKSEKVLGFTPKVKFKELVEIMTDAEL